MSSSSLRCVLRKSLLQNRKKNQKNKDMRTETVTSAQNPKIKELLALQEKSRTRREKSLFIVEGRRELEHCLHAGFQARTLFVCPEILRANEFDRLVRLCADDLQVIEVPEHLYNKIAYRGGTEGLPPAFQLSCCIRRMLSSGSTVISARAACRVWSSVRSSSRRGRRAISSSMQCQASRASRKPVSVR